MGIPVHGSLRDGLTSVTRRRTDDLPPHVKGRAYFRELPRSPGGRPNANTGYWIDILGPDGQKTHELPLEFVTTDELGDRWATITFEANHWWIPSEANLAPTNNPDLGWWTTDDPQHPNYTPPVIAAAAAPAPIFHAPAPAPAPMATPAAAAAPAPVNGALRGLPPPIFDGDRTKSVGFLLAFHLYKFTNRGHKAMTNPATRTTTALSYITGPLVEV